MAGGGFTDAGTLKRAHLYEYKITGYFVFACIVAALGGSLFGYDLGVSGGCGRNSGTKVWARSWGPLGWLVPSEIFPLETRSAGQSVVVCVNLLFTALIAQCFLASLCHLKYGIFLVFGGLIIIMSSFIFFLLPETKQVPIEEVYLLWQTHWFWKNIVGGEGEQAGDSDGRSTLHV
ncbi:hypothetical protein FH972_003212 [Carpinus fangiana]|uniref:Major facilitator superfamily (MFS) profile domain-containing protein n=1 Tax=Carpinus fangiana TaxID=176857 RepID=A0A5N6QHT5_9ROSI|nr:hypothetical protein FH972_003212 [Carpinus fangiana]